MWRCKDVPRGAKLFQEAGQGPGQVASVPTAVKPNVIQPSGQQTGRRVLTSLLPLLLLNQSGFRFWTLRGSIGPRKQMLPCLNCCLRTSNTAGDAAQTQHRRSGLSGGRA